MFPLKEEEGFGPILGKCLQAARNMYDLLEKSEKLKAFKKPELDILGYFPVDVNSTSEISAKSKEVFDVGMREQTFYLSLYKIPADTFGRLHPQYEVDSEQVTILRSVFMKPEQAEFVEELVNRIEKHC
jgi:hypothetical protein